MVNYKPERLVSNLRLPKEQKRAKTTISRKNLSEKSVEGMKNELFTKSFLSSIIFFNINRISFFYQYIFKKPNMNKYITTTKFFKKTRSINAVNFNIFQPNPLNTLNYAFMGQYNCWPFIFGQYGLTTSYWRWKQQQRHATTKKSVEKCQKKVSKQFKS